MVSGSGEIPGVVFLKKCIFREVWYLRPDCCLTLPYTTYSRKRDGSLRLPASRLGNGPASGPASLTFVRSKTRFSKERLRRLVLGFFISILTPEKHYSRKRDGSLRLPASRLGNGNASIPASLAFVRSKTEMSFWSRRR